jgi:hypothetical protein
MVIRSQSQTWTWNYSNGFFRVSLNWPPLTSSFFTMAYYSFGCNIPILITWQAKIISL